MNERGSLQGLVHIPHLDPSPRYPSPRYPSPRYPSPRSLASRVSTFRLIVDQVLSWQHVARTRPGPRVIPHQGQKGSSRELAKAHDVSPFGQVCRGRKWKSSGYTGRSDVLATLCRHGYSAIPPPTCNPALCVFWISSPPRTSRGSPSYRCWLDRWSKGSARVAIARRTRDSASSSKSIVRTFVVTNFAASIGKSLARAIVSTSVSSRKRRICGARCWSIAVVRCSTGATGVKVARSTFMLNN